MILILYLKLQNVYAYKIPELAFKESVCSNFGNAKLKCFYNNVFYIPMIRANMRTKLTVKSLL